MTEIINRSAVLRPAWHYRALADSRSGATKPAKAVYICSTHWSMFARRRRQNRRL